jgi:hypothetical protein
MADSSTDRAGTGTHRRFSRDEAIIACILHGFALHQIAIGELIVISDAVRGWLNMSGIRRLFIDPAIGGDSSPCLIFESWRGGRPAVTAFKGEQPEFKYLRKPEGFAAIICLQTYLSKIGE